MLGRIGNSYLSGEFYKNFKTILHAKRRHILPSYLSKIASLDTNNLSAEVSENYLLKSLDVKYSEQVLRRGVRTFSEVSHFVRCIPLI